MSPSPCFAAVYIRVSTEDQTELSPDSQLSEIRRYAQQNGMVVLADHIYIDAGISGKKASRRPEFLRMISAAKESDHPFHVILVWKFSRFARNQEESIFYKSILRSKCGVDVVSISEPLIAGPFGSLIERIIEWMDEFYSIRLSQEVKRSMTINAQRGKLQCTASFGYRFENGALVPDEKEAPILRHIFQQFLSGKGLYTIARELNDLGVRTHRGNPFENRTIEYILRNPVYIGKLRWNPSGHTRRDFSNENIITADASHPPLVSTETWEAAQRRLDEVKAQWGYKARPVSDLKHWLSGLVRCASCGTTLIFARPHYYKCANYAKGRCRTSQHIRADLLAEALLSRLEFDVSSTSVLSYEVVYSNSSGGSEISRLESSLKQVDTRLRRLQDAYLSGVVELSDYACVKKELDRSAAQLQEELSLLRSRSDEQSILLSLRAAISSALQTLRSSETSTEEKHNAARSILDSCTFDKSSSTLSITYRIIF